MTEPRSKGGFQLGDYVEVKDRIKLFYAAHPDGRLVTGEWRISIDDDTPRVIVQAFAYRTADDPLPGQGWSWMELPGKTPYTKGSELENTETSAWGRAIGSLGIGIDKSIASQNEIDAKADAPQRPELERQVAGLVGEVERGKPPVDLELRETPDGHAWGFKLKSGRTGYQALATGPLAVQLSDAVLVAPPFEGQRVQVWGRIEMIPWDKAGKPMPPFARIAVERVQTDDWTLPREEAPSESLGLLTDEDKAAIGGGMP